MFLLAQIRRQSAQELPIGMERPFGRPRIAAAGKRSPVFEFLVPIVARVRDAHLPEFEHLVRGRAADFRSELRAGFDVVGGEERGPTRYEVQLQEKKLLLE